MKLSTFLFLVSVLLMMHNIYPCFSKAAEKGLDNKVLCIESEREALLSFKKDLVDRARRLSSWNALDEPDCCKWARVVCGNFTGHVHELHLGNPPLEYYYTFAEYEAYQRSTFGGKINPSLQHLKHLRVLDLSCNNFGGISIPTFIGSLVSLQHLNLSNAGFAGFIPPQIGNLSCLRSLVLQAYIGGLDIKNNNLQWLSGLQLLTQLDMSGVDLHQIGEWLEVVNTLSSLHELRLSYCRLPSSLPYTWNISSSLAMLDISNNSLGPEIPSWIFSLHNLIALELGGNSVSGHIPESLWNLSSLKYLGIGYNKLEGIVSEDHLNKLTNLRFLWASGIALTLNVSHSWVPQFSLKVLSMRGWKLGPQFPSWLQSQKDLVSLDISDTGILDNVPAWLWNMSKQFGLFSLAENQIYGQVPKIFHGHEIESIIDLSSNQFSGPLPILSPKVQRLYLSNNSFSGDISHFLCQRTETQYKLLVLDLQNNFLSGEIPDCWMVWSSLTAVLLGNNNFSGQIPTSMGYLTHLGLLHLDNNSLSGELPLSLQNCSWLRTLDLNMNAFKGKLPTWIGSHTSMQFLTIRSNRFEGEIPKELCLLTSLRILDIAHNNFSGTIPSCFKNFTAMSMGGESGFISFRRDGLEVESILVVTKDRDMVYESILGLARSMDLSSNNLSGEIPSELMSLVALQSLNLSHNHFSGTIPRKIGYIRSLESLDLSWNQISGRIPESMSKLNFLSLLNLSYNNLSGQIPLSTQLERLNPSGFIGNNLCGSPLPDKCGTDSIESTPIVKTPEDDEGKNEKDSMWFYLGIAWGFVVGFWGICGPLFFNRSWRLAYFKFLDRAWEKIISIVTKCKGFLA